MIGRISASTMFLRIVALVIAVLFALVIAFSSPGISDAKNKHKGKNYKNRHHHGHSKNVHKKKKRDFTCSPTNVQVGEYRNDIDQDLQCFRVNT
jgi:anionic cell wall polymer biosynthesis LytR-Cps2A-Psr (LCP) family protein